jgi:hypothetical protein
MIAIETENGRFEAETLKEAKKLADKAEREARKQSAAREVLTKTARERAEAQGFRMIRSRHLNGNPDKPFPRGWRFIPSHSSGIQCVKQLPKSDSWYYPQLQIETEAGTGLVEFSGRRLWGWIENGAGFCLAVVVDSIYSKDPKVCAVGVCDNVAWYEEVPTVQPSEFSGWPEGD